MYELIEFALKRVKFYNTDIYAKKDKYLKIMDERDVDKVSIIFPESCYMMTKRGRSDYAFNLQEVMTEDHIILTGLLLAQPNDKIAIKDIIKDIKQTRKLFIEMQKEFGERRNYIGIFRMLQRYILIADAGYFSVKNLYYIARYQINALVMPTSLAEKNNNELRIKNGDEETRKNSTRKGFIRVKNGYRCPQGKLMRLVKVRKINHRKPHPDDLLPDRCKKKTFIFETESCEGCPNIDTCKHKVIKDQYSWLHYNMTEKFLDKRRNFNYMLRFSRSESINGFLKGSDGILKLIGTTPNAVNNELQLRNVVYNLTRFINLKDTAY